MLLPVLMLGAALLEAASNQESLAGKFRALHKKELLMLHMSRLVPAYCMSTVMAT